MKATPIENIPPYKPPSEDQLGNMVLTSLHEEAGKAIHTLLEDGYRMRQADGILTDYLNETHGVVIINEYGAWVVFNPDTNDILLRTYIYADALRCALDQSIVKKSSQE